MENFAAVSHLRQEQPTPALSNEELADWIRQATENDPERLKHVASLLLERSDAPGSDEERGRRKPTGEALKKRLEEEAARGWARFRQKLQKVTSYADAQTLADTIPRDARERERAFYVHLGQFIQTRVMPDAASANERAELEILLLRLSTTPAETGSECHGADGP